MWYGWLLGERSGEVDRSKGVGELVKRRKMRERREVRDEAAGTRK